MLRIFRYDISVLRYCQSGSKKWTSQGLAFVVDILSQVFKFFPAIFRNRPAQFPARVFFGGELTPFKLKTVDG